MIWNEVNLTPAATQYEPTSGGTQPPADIRPSAALTVGSGR